MYVRAKLAELVERLASKVTARPVGGFGSVVNEAVTVPADPSTVTVFEALAVSPALSVTVKVIVKSPAFEYVWLRSAPLQLELPGHVMMPVESPKFQA